MNQLLKWNLTQTGKSKLRLNKLNLRSKLIIAFLIVALAPVALLGVLGNNLARTTLIKRGEAKLLSTASQTAAVIDNFILTNLDSIKAEAHLPDIVDYLSLPRHKRVSTKLESRVLTTLNMLFSKHTLFTQSYSLLDRAGIEAISTQVSTRGQDRSKELYYLEPLQNGLPYVSPIQFYNTSSEGSIYFSYPVRHRKTMEIIGVLVIHYNANILQHFIVQSDDLTGTETFALLLDENLVRLADTSERGLLHKLIIPLNFSKESHLKATHRIPGLSAETLATNLPDLATGLRQATTDKPYFSGILHPGKTIQHGAAVKLRWTPWQVAIIQDQSFLLAPVNTQTRNALWLLIVVVVVVFMVAAFVSYWLARPIAHLTNIATQISAGDLSVRAPIETQDDIGTLAKVFNSMTGQLSETIDSLEYRVAERTQELEQKQQVLQDQAAELVQRTAQLEAANKELETFSYSVSHDLRAPLRAIDGFSLALAEDYSESLDETGLDYLNRVRNSAQRMGHLIDDLLQLSRINNRVISFKTVDLTALAREVMDELQAIDPDRKVNFSLSEDLQVEGDPRLLRIMLDNLLGNAWKFTSKKDKAMITFGRLEDNPKIFFIRDNGVGFNMDYAKKLFGVFQRLHRVTDYPGTGIGLATVQRILNRHGGKIWVQAKEGDGAIFFLTFVFDKNEHYQQKYN